MQLTKYHKTIILCSSFTCGIISVHLAYTPYILVGFCILAAVFLYKKTVSVNFAAVCFLTLAFSIFYANYRQPAPDYLYKIAPSKLNIRGRIVSVPQVKSENQSRFMLDVSEVEENGQWKKIKAKTLVSVYYKYDRADVIVQGDVIKLNASLKRPFTAGNPGQFDYGKYLENSNVYTVATASFNNYNILEHPKCGYWAILSTVNNLTQQIIKTHSKYLDDTKLQILGGVVFGSTAVPPSNEIKQNFISSGLYHLLAASGMNVGMIFGMWFFLTRKFMPYRWTIASGAVLVLLYSLMTGLPPSVTRAAWMLELALLGKFIDRKNDNILLLILTGVIMLLHNPNLVNDIGFQLSFIVTFGILTTMPIVTEKTQKHGGIILDAALVPLVAQIWVCPIQIFHFNTFAVYTIIANMLVMPFIAIITFAGFIGSVLCLIPLLGEQICRLGDLIASPFLNLLLWCSEFFASQPNALIYLAKPSVLTIIVFYLLILFSVIGLKFDFKNKKLNYSILFFISCLIFLIFSLNFSKKPEFVFFNVGKGNSTLIHTADNKNILIDAGNSAKRGFSPANSIILPYLRDAGIYKLDALILTSSDKYHSGGAEDILKGIRTDAVYKVNEPQKSNLSAITDSYLTQKDIKKFILQDKQSINIGKYLKLNVLFPKKVGKKELKTNFAVLLVNYNGYSALFVPENRFKSLQLPTENIKSPINLLKVDGQKIYEYLDEKFLNSLNLQLVIISKDKNRKNKSDAQTIDLFKNNHIKYLKTDDDKAVKINFDGQKVKVFTFDTNSAMWKHVN